MKRRNEVLVGAPAHRRRSSIGIARHDLARARRARVAATRCTPSFRWGQNLKVGQPVRARRRADRLRRRRRARATTARWSSTWRSRTAARCRRTRAPSSRRSASSATRRSRCRRRRARSAYASGDTVPAGVPAAGITELTAKADSVATVAVNVSRRLQTELVDTGAAARHARRRSAARTRSSRRSATIAAEQSRAAHRARRRRCAARSPPSTRARSTRR